MGEGEGAEAEYIFYLLYKITNNGHCPKMWDRWTTPAVPLPDYTCLLNIG